MQPSKLGRYEILEELGRGAMGQVLLAYDPQIDRKVAIKIVRGFEPSSDDADSDDDGDGSTVDTLPSVQADENVVGIAPDRDLHCD